MAERADIEAAIDVLKDVIEDSDSYDVETAIALRDVVEDLRKKAGEAVSLLSTQLVNTLESPRQFGSKVYAVVAEGTWRPEHEAVRAAVLRRAIVDGNGELVQAPKAARQAVDLMYELFVSPSTMPKVSGLKQVALSKKDVARWEQTGRKVQVLSVDGPQDDD